MALNNKEIPYTLIEKGLITRISLELNITIGAHLFFKFDKFITAPSIGSYNSMKIQVFSYGYLRM